MTIFAAENYQPSQKMISPLMTVYGSVGVGKSTFAASFPKPFFFDFEGRTLHIKNIVRDADYGIDIVNLQNWGQLINAVHELGATDFKTIVFDGITTLQNFVWDEVGRQLNNANPRSMAYGVGYGRAAELFASLMFAAKELQMKHNKIIIFIDHEKVKEEDALVVNSKSICKYHPECMNGISKILAKESDYIFRLTENITVREDKKTGDTSAIFNGLILQTDRKHFLEAELKSSLPLPAMIKATYEDFKEAYKSAYQKIHADHQTVEKIAS
jgi:AAA domain